jgi:hypothetical protein
MRKAFEIPSKKQFARTPIISDKERVNGWRVFLCQWSGSCNNRLEKYYLTA